MELVCESENEVSDMPLIWRDSGKIVRPYGGKVEKTYLNDDFFRKVIAIYKATTSYPNVEHLLHKQDIDQAIVVQKAVVAKPNNRDKLIACLQCVYEALEWLHGEGFVHRDIKWENVLDMSNVEKWVSVDLNEAIRSDDCLELHTLDASSHAPEMTAKPHGTIVDIWDIGYLLSTSNIILDIKLWDLMEKCLLPLPNQRPTARECLGLLGA